jgi:hypothetical protein
MKAFYQMTKEEQNNFENKIKDSSRKQKKAFVEYTKAFSNLAKLLSKKAEQMLILGQK